MAHDPYLKHDKFPLHDVPSFISDFPPRKFSLRIKYTVKNFQRRWILKLLSVRKDLEKCFSKVGSYFLQHTKHGIVPTLLKSPLWAYYSFKSNEAICLLSLAAFETFIEFFKSVDGYPSVILELQLLNMCYMQSFYCIFYSLVFFFIFLHAEFWIIPSYLSSCLIILS